MVTAGLAVVAACSLLLLSEAVPLWLPGGRIAVPTTPSALGRATLVPGIVVVMTSVGLTCAAALLAVVAVRVAVVPRVLLLLAAALPGLTLLVGLNNFHLHTTALTRWCPIVGVVVTGGACVAASVGRLRRPLWLAIGLGFPWAAYGVLLVRTPQPDAYVAVFSLILVYKLLAPLFAVLLAWQVFEALRGSDALAERFHRNGRADHRGVLIASIAMLAALVVGIGGRLPAGLGGTSDAWQAARADGWLQWLLALSVAAVIVGGVLICERTRSIDRGLPVGAVAIVGALLIATALANAAAMIGEVVSEVGVVGIGPPLRRVSGWEAGHDDTLRLVPLAVTGAAGALIAWRWPRLRAAALTMIAFVLWAGPATLALATGSRQPPVALETLVTAIVAVLVAVTVVQFARRRPLSPAVPIALVIFGAIAATQPLDAAVEHATAALGEAFFYLALVAPVVYRFVGAGRSLQPAGIGTNRLLIIVAAAAATISLTMFAVSLGALAPGVADLSPNGDDPLFRLFIAIPLGAGLVAASGSRLRAAAGGAAP